MKSPLTINIFIRRTIILLVLMPALACNFLSRHTGNETAPTAPEQTTQVSPPVTTDKPTEPPSEEIATEIPSVAASTAGAYSPVISDRYPFFLERHTIGSRLVANPGNVWIGTISGTVVQVDSQTGAFGQSISLAPESGGSMPMAFPVLKMAFEGQSLWVLAGFSEDDTASPHLVAVDPKDGKIIRQWDLNSPEWMENYERMSTPEDFGVSPGKIWIDSHIVDTQTFDVQAAYMPALTLFAYDGKEWMWMNGEMGGSCDDLILVNVNDPTRQWCEEDWPFFTHAADGIHPIGMGSPMLFAGDKLWMAGGWPAESLSDAPDYLLEAFPADIDDAMKTTGPLVSVPLIEGASNVLMIFAGDYLWLVCTGDQAGWLYQVDTQTGEIINSLDLVGDEGRATGDIPQDVATEGDNLWVLTSRQLLRIKLP